MCKAACFSVHICAQRLVFVQEKESFATSIKVVSLFMAGTRNKWLNIWLLQSPLNTRSVLWDKRCLLVSGDLCGVGNPDGLVQQSLFTVGLIYSGKQCVLSPLLDPG